MTRLRLPIDLSAKGKMLWAAIAVLLIAAAIWGFHPGSRAGEAHAADGAAPAMSAGSFRLSKTQLDALTIVRVAAVSFRREQITDGTVAFDDDTTTPVFSPYTGLVIRLFAKPGDVVAKGAPLMSVEASEFVQGQTDLVTALGTLSSAKAQVTLMEAAEKRQHDLYLVKAGALKDWLQSQSDLAAAMANFRTAEIAADAARNRLKILGKSDGEIAAVEHAPSIGRMNPEAVVRSPITGTVIQRQVSLGQNIQSAVGGASSPVYVVGNLATAWLVANVRETDAAQLKVGQPVEVRVLAFPDRVFKARISWVAPGLDPTTHRLPVRADVDNRDGSLKPMMSGSFRILVGDATTAPAVPQEAIVYEGANAHVFVAIEDGTLKIRPIHTGRSSGDLVEVTDGIAAGERVVTRGALFIDRAMEAK